MKYKINKDGGIISGYFADENGEYTEEEAERIVICQDIDATESDYEKKQAEKEAEYQANEYARNRKIAYDSVGDQLDMQYHDQLNGTTTWKDAIAKVKSDNPKE